MASHYREQRRLDPTAANAMAAATARRPDGTPDDNDRVEIGPTALAFAEWAEAGIAAPDLGAMRLYRLNRLVEQIRQRDLAGVLLFDPLNIRYASDTTNMQLWAAHNPFRACFVGADGHMIVWDYRSDDLLTGFNPLVRETRSGASFFYFASGERKAQDAALFAAEISDVVRAHGGGVRRLAVDKIMIDGLRALDVQGLQIADGEELMERTRAVKGPDEIQAMRCAVHACERAVAEMHRAARAGISENEIWAVLHAENIRRGGEWIETRLLCSGPRTNPWFQECGPRVLQNNELLAFDTDLIGCYGQCCDMSRTWFIGDGLPTVEQRRLYRAAADQIDYNRTLLVAGRSIDELSHLCLPLPAEFSRRRYSCVMHGVGLCDEWPLVRYAEDHEAGRVDALLEPGMMLCVEAYIGAENGRDGVKLEDQILITENGPERMTCYPYDMQLLA